MPKIDIARTASDMMRQVREVQIARALDRIEEAALEGNTEALIPESLMLEHVEKQLVDLGYNIGEEKVSSDDPDDDTMYFKVSFGHADKGREIVYEG